MSSACLIGFFNNDRQSLKNLRLTLQMRFRAITERAKYYIIQMPQRNQVPHPSPRIFLRVGARGVGDIPGFEDGEDIAVGGLDLAFVFGDCFGITGEGFLEGEFSVVDCAPEVRVKGELGDVDHARPGAGGYARLFFGIFCSLLGGRRIGSL